MTLEEKQKTIVAELLACLRQIVSDETTKLNHAKWHAAVGLHAAHIIATEGRQPTSEESVEWVKRQGWAFLN